MKKKQLPRKLTDCRPSNPPKLSTHKLSLKTTLQSPSIQITLPHHKYCTFEQPRSRSKEEFELQLQLQENKKENMRLNLREVDADGEDLLNFRGLNQSTSYGRSVGRNPRHGFQVLEFNSIQNENQGEVSVCPSIENGIIEGYLENLQDQINIKSDAVSLAQNLIKTTLQQNRILTQQNTHLKQLLQSSQTQIQQLQLQLQLALQTAQKPKKPDTTPLKRSITKTYTTQRNIPAPSNNTISVDASPLQLLSGEIVGQFIVSYESLISQLTEWIEREQKEELEGNFVGRVNVLCGEVEDFLYGGAKSEYGEECSKTTYETLANENNKYFLNPTLDPKKPPFQLNYTQYQFQQIIQLYRQQLTKQSSLLFESITYIQQLQKSLQRCTSTPNSPRALSPRTLIPSQLINIVRKECNKIIHATFRELKQENLELVGVVNGMIQWIGRSCGNSGEVLGGWGAVGRGVGGGVGMGGGMGGGVNVGMGRGRDRDRG